MASFTSWLVNLAVWIRGTWQSSAWVRTLAQVGAAVALSEVARRLATGDSQGGQDPQREITVRSAVAYQNIVYGRALVGGVTVYHNAVPWGGNLNNHMFQAITYAGHVIDGVEGLYLDDRYLDFSVDSLDWDPSQPITGLNRGKVHTGEFRGNTGANPAVYARYYLGDQNSADAIMVQEISEWTVDHIGAGHAYGILEIHQEPMGRNDFEQTSKIFESGFPRNTMAVVRGKLVYDPRSDSPGTHRVDSDGTWQWSDNPALQVADYIRDTNVGMADSYSNIYWPAVHSAAEYCDATVYTPSGTQARFTGNGVLNTGETHGSNLKSLLSSFNGRLTWISSGWYLSAGWDAPTKEINEGMLTGDVQALGALDKRDTYNHVRGWFYDKDEQYTQTAYATVTAPEYIARDNSEYLYRDVALPMTTDWWEAQRVAFNILDQGDNQRVVELPLDYSGFDLMVGKTATINLDVFSWSNKAFRMTDWQFDPIKGIVLSAREDFQASYTDPSTTDYTAVIDTATVSSGGLIVPSIDPSSIAVEPEVESVRLRWVSPSARAYEWVDIYWNQTNNLSDSNTEMASVRGNEFVHSLPRGNELYYYWFQARDFASNVSSFTPNTQSSTLIAQSRFPVQRDPSLVYLEEFDYRSLVEYRKRWFGTGPNSAGVGFSFPSSGTYGRKALSIDSATCHEVEYTKIPVDPDSIYKYEATIRYNSAPNSGFIADLGFVGYDRDLNPLAYTGSSNYLVGQYGIASQGVNISSNYPVSTFHKLGGYIANVRSDGGNPIASNQATVPHRAGRFHEDVQYMSPAFAWTGVGGGSNGPGVVCVIDTIKVTRLPNNDPIVFDPYIALQKNWRKGIGSTLANAVDDLDLLEEDAHEVLNIDNVQAEYCQIGYGPQASPSNFEVAVERVRLEHHRILPGSLDVLWTGRVMVCSHATTIPTMTPVVVAYTQAGSPAGYFENGDISFVAFSKWENHVKRIPVSVASAEGYSGYTGPFYLTMGMKASLPSGSTSTSHFLTDIRGQFI